MSDLGTPALLAIFIGAALEGLLVIAVVCVTVMSAVLPSSASIGPVGVGAIGIVVIWVIGIMMVNRTRDRADLTLVAAATGDDGGVREQPRAAAATPPPRARPRLPGRAAHLRPRPVGAARRLGLKKAGAAAVAGTGGLVDRRVTSLSPSPRSPAGLAAQPVLHRPRRSRATRSGSPNSWAALTSPPPS
jgi:hypothetical protein